MIGSSSWSSRITGRIRTPVVRPEGALTRSGEPVERKMTEAPEPEDKLDAATAMSVTANGPEDAPFDWRQVDWRRVEDDVRRLRQRIFTASKAGDLKKVRNLQKLMLRSHSNTLVSVRRVAERNAGRLTAGVDGEVVLTPQAKAGLADRVHRMTEPFKAMPVRRVYIPKAGSRTRRRPLGIPVIADRCHQARVVNALEPEWEARFEPSPTGFGRAAAATTRSRPSTRSSRAQTRDGCGFWTQIWPGRSTASPTTTSFACSARSPPGEWLRNG